MKTTEHHQPKFSAKVPESVTTPDKLHTELLGDLEFFDGMPSKETVKKAYDSSTAFQPLPSMVCLKGSKRPALIRVIWAFSKS
jgi:hypothetical protein